MKIDKTRFEMFWKCPDQYRLREVWNIQPIEPAEGTAERKRQFGKFQGICFHELMDGLYHGVSLEETAAKLEDNFGLDEIEGALNLAKGIRDNYPPEVYLAHEAQFEYLVPGSSHSLVGRIDHIFERNGEILVGDWKTHRYRSESARSKKADEYCRSAQVDFYLLGARALGHDPRAFTYRLVSNRGDGGSARVEVKEFRAERSDRELTNFARAVSMTCDLIETWKAKYDPQLPWPVFPTEYPTGFEPRLGKAMYHGFMPDGFESKREHLELLKEQV